MPNVELGATVEPVRGGSTPNKLVLEIDVSDATIGDMQAIDRLASGQPGAFADGIDILARFVKNVDIRTRPRHEFKVIAEAIMAQFREGTEGN